MPIGNPMDSWIIGFQESWVQIPLRSQLFIQLHAVSRTQQRRQREPSVRHSVPHFLSKYRVQNSTPRFASTPERRNGNINVSKYFISSNGDRTHNQLVLQSHFVPLRHDWPQVIYTFSKKLAITYFRFEYNEKTADLPYISFLAIWVRSLDWWDFE